MLAKVEIMEKKNQLRFKTNEQQTKDQEMLVRRLSAELANEKTVNAKREKAKDL